MSPEANRRSFAARKFQSCRAYSHTVALQMTFALMTALRPKLLAKLAISPLTTALSSCIY